MKPEELEALKKQLAALQAENEALKAAAPQDADGIEGLKKNRDTILDEKKKLQAKLDRLEAAAKEKETKALEEQKKFEELYQKEQVSHRETVERLAEISRKNNLTQAAAKAGMDTKYLPMLNNVEYNEDGTIKDEEALFSSVKESFPLFFEDRNPKAPDSHNGKPNILGGGGQKFTTAQFNDPEFFEKNRDAMMAAFTNGEITD